MLDCVLISVTIVPYLGTLVKWQNGFTPYSSILGKTDYRGRATPRFVTSAGGPLSRVALETILPHIMI